MGDNTISQSNFPSVKHYFPILYVVEFDKYATKNQNGTE